MAIVPGPDGKPAFMITSQEEALLLNAALNQVLQSEEAKSVEDDLSKDIIGVYEDWKAEVLQVLHQCKCGKPGCN